MKITNEKVQKIVSDGKEKGLDIRLRDVACFVLEKSFGDPSIAYRVTFDQNASPDAVDIYIKGRVYAFVSDWFNKHNNAQEVSDSLTFTENKAALIEMLNEITELAESGEIPYKDAMKMKTDIRVKLQDRFQVQDEDKGTIVVVPPKYNKICPHTQRECYEMSEEYACRQFHLIKDPSWVDLSEK